MKCLYFDCFAGISGDMMLGALIDLGVPQKYLKTELAKLTVADYSLRVANTMRMGISARQVSVKPRSSKPHHKHRTFKDIEKIILKSSLSGAIKDRSIDIFTRIAKAEAQIHKKKVTEIHFHEVGALDSIIDIVGTAIGIDYLGIEQCAASAVPLGHGFVKCQHGTLPVPAPATLKLLQGVPVHQSGIEAELVTPTGAAILTSCVKDFGPLPPMSIESIGYGAGTRELEAVPNLLRLILGESQGATGKEYVCVLEANIDDMNPEWAGYLMEQLFAEGALDVVFIPVYMKKNRPAVLLQVICAEEKQSLLTGILFQESTTAGVRSYRTERVTLKRRTGKVKTKFGIVKVKILGEGQEERIVPEFEECRRIALKRKASLQEVYAAVINTVGS